MASNTAVPPVGRVFRYHLYAVLTVSRVFSYHF